MNPSCYILDNIDIVFCWMKNMMHIFKIVWHSCTCSCWFRELKGAWRRCSSVFLAACKKQSSQRVGCSSAGIMFDLSWSPTLQAKHDIWKQNNFFSPCSVCPLLCHTTHPYCLPMPSSSGLPSIMMFRKSIIQKKHHPSCKRLIYHEI